MSDPALLCLPEITCIICGAGFDRSPTHWTCRGCGVSYQTPSEVSPDDVAWLWAMVAALAPLAWFLGDLQGDPAYPFEPWSEHIPCLWSQVAQAALSQMLDDARDAGSAP